MFWVRSVVIASHAIGVMRNDPGIASTVALRAMVDKSARQLPRNDRMYFTIIQFSSASLPPLLTPVVQLWRTSGFGCGFGFGLTDHRSPITLA